MRIRALLTERSRVAADLANVQKGMRDLQLLVARRGITRDRAELVLAQCAEEVKRLTERLADMDQSLPVLRADSGA
jgi:hypothetical protein